MGDVKIYKAAEDRKTHWLRWTDHRGVERRLSSKTTDKSLANYIGRNIEILQNCRIRKQTPDPDLLTWVHDTLDPYLRDHLLEWGILDARTAESGRSLATIIAEWKQAFVDRERDDAYADTSARRLTVLFAAAGIDSIHEIAAEKISSALLNLRNGRVDPAVLKAIDPPLREQDLKKLAKGLSPLTCNHYLDKAQEFCEWAKKWTGTNPLAGMKGYDRKVVDSNRVYDRRPLDPEEQTTLLTTVAASPVVRFELDGPARHLVYLTVLYTGLRPKELKAITRAAFNLDEKEPTITILATIGKARREDTLPLHSCLLAPLAAHFAAKAPAALAFDLPHEDTLVDMIRQDLAAAGIPDTDDLGRRLDFYSLRHTYGTNLARVGVPFKLHMELMRHKDVATTMRFYVSLTINDRRAAVQKLAEPPAVVQKKKVG